MPISILNRLISIILFLSVSALSGCGTTPSAPSLQHTEHLNIPIDSLRSADLAFRLGRTLQSSAIAAGANKEARYSHIGIIVRLADDVSVIHIEPQRGGDEGVRCERLEEFFAPDKASAGAIVRLDNLTCEQRQIISQYLLLVARSPIRFDHDYTLSDTTRMYCNELTEWAYSKAGITLSAGRRHSLPLASEAVILPGDILQRNDVVPIWTFPSR